MTLSWATEDVAIWYFFNKNDADERFWKLEYEILLFSFNLTDDWSLSFNLTLQLSASGCGYIKYSWKLSAIVSCKWHQIMWQNQELWTYKIAHEIETEMCKLCENQIQKVFASKKNADSC